MKRFKMDVSVNGKRETYRIQVRSRRSAFNDALKSKIPHRLDDMDVRGRVNISMEITELEESE